MNSKKLGPYELNGSVLEGLYWVNGRLVNVRRVTSIRKIRAGEYEVDTTHLGTFTVRGGRHSGGALRDWFIQGGEFGDRPYWTTGLVAAIRVIENI